MGVLPLTSVTVGLRRDQGRADHSTQCISCISGCQLLQESKKEYFAIILEKSLLLQGTNSGTRSGVCDHTLPSSRLNKSRGQLLKSADPASVWAVVSWTQRCFSTAIMSFPHTGFARKLHPLSRHKAEVQSSLLIQK